MKLQPRFAVVCLLAAACRDGSSLGGDGSTSSHEDTDDGASTSGSSSGPSSTSGVDSTGHTAPEDPEMTCARLIECAEETGIPVTPLIAQFGEDGTCWEEFEAEACVTDCEAVLAPLVVECSASAPACCAPPIVDVENSVFGCVDLGRTTIADRLIDPGAPIECGALSDPSNGRGAIPDGLELQSDCTLGGEADVLYPGFYVWLTRVQQGDDAQVVPLCLAVGDATGVSFDLGAGEESPMQPLFGEFDDGPVAFSGASATVELCDGPCETPFSWGYSWFVYASFFDETVPEPEGSDAGITQPLEFSGPPIGMPLGRPWVHAVDFAWCVQASPLDPCTPDVADRFAHVSVLMRPG